MIYEGLNQSERSGKIVGAPQEHWRVRIKKIETCIKGKRYDTELLKRGRLVDRHGSLEQAGPQSAVGGGLGGRGKSGGGG